MKKKKVLSLCAVFALSAVMLVSCMREVAKISDSAGVSRKDAQLTEEARVQEIQEKEEKREKEDKIIAQQETGITEPVGDMWKYENGNYVFRFPERDRSAEKDISDLESLRGTKFSDQPDDWYCGKTSYDEKTGEVTYVWDRSKDTLDAVEKYGAIYRGDTERKVCYFTFDCGYEYGPTGKILDTLKEKHVSGTFFLTGDYVRTEYDLIKRMLDEGHVVGNHTESHPHCNQLTGQEFIDELEALEKRFYEKFPEAQPLVLFRPPYGNSNEYILALTERMGYHTVMWSYTYMDYDTENQLSYDDAMAKVKGGLHPGCVYLFHTESTTNAAILGDFIDWVREQGYEILPVVDIIDGESE